MNTRATYRMTLLAATCGAVLASPAYAMYSGTVLTGAQVPDWAVGNYSCSGTLITPRVAVTAGHCTSGNPTSGFFHRKTGQVYYGKTATYPERYGPLGDVGILMTDSRFGGNGNVETAPIASYQEEKLALQNAAAGSNGTPLVVYAKDSYQNSFTVARTTDAYTGTYLGSGQGYLEGTKMLYRSVSSYRASEPDRLAGLRMHAYENIFDTALAVLMYTDPNGLKLTDLDVDDAVVLTATQRSPFAGSPIFPGDSGGGIFFRKPNGDLRLVSNISGTDAHVRLSSYWPWMVKTLVTQGMRDDAIVLSQKVLGTGTWGTNDRKGVVGQIYVYDNPYNRKVEYFRLASLGNDGRYWYFPTNQKDNEYWEYLGNDLPDIEQATTALGVWGANDRRGKLGDIFIYNNPYSSQVEYFRLKGLGGDGRYWHFPTNQTNNEYWDYLGNNLPTRPIKFAQRVK